MTSSIVVSKRIFTAAYESQRAWRAGSVSDRRNPFSVTLIIGLLRKHIDITRHEMVFNQIPPRYQEQHVAVGPGRLHCPRRCPLATRFPAADKSTAQPLKAFRGRPHQIGRIGRIGGLGVDPVLERAQADSVKRNVRHNVVAELEAENGRRHRLGELQIPWPRHREGVGPRDGNTRKFEPLVASAATAPPWLCPVT